MDVLEELKKIKNKKLKEEVKKAILTTLKNADEELYFEEETVDLAGKNYIKNHLVAKDGQYYVKVTNEGPFCVKCWDETGELIIKKQNGQRFECSVCKISLTYKNK